MRSDWYYSLNIEQSIVSFSSDMNKREQIELSNDVFLQSMNCPQRRDSIDSEASYDSIEEGLEKMRRMVRSPDRYGTSYRTL